MRCLFSFGVTFKHLRQLQKHHMSEAALPKVLMKKKNWRDGYIQNPQHSTMTGIIVPAHQESLLAQ